MHTSYATAEVNGLSLQKETSKHKSLTMKDEEHKVKKSTEYILERNCNEKPPRKIKDNIKFPENGLRESASLEKVHPEYNIVERDSPLNMQVTAKHRVVVAIDFGTTYSGYAYSFTDTPDTIQIMRKWEGDDPGINNQKTPTVLLLSPDKEFHSFGFTARDFYHDMDTREASKWFYFDKFKMLLHHNKYLGRNTWVESRNGKEMKALKVFSIVLRYFKEHALQELRDATGTKLSSAGIGSTTSVYISGRMVGGMSGSNPGLKTPMVGGMSGSNPGLKTLCSESTEEGSEDYVLEDSETEKEFTLPTNQLTPQLTSEELFPQGGSYMVVDCGGGTVDITVHEISTDGQQLREVFKATGGPYGSVSVDLAFENLLSSMFGAEFIQEFRKKRPAGYIDLMIAFESRKRCASPFKLTPLSVALPFSFIDLYRKTHDTDIGQAVNKFGCRDIKWSSEGMIRIETELMKQFFKPTLTNIKEHILSVLNEPDVRGLTHLFLVGGFAESSLLQEEIRHAFRGRLKVIIPQGVGLAVLRGAVQYGLDPAVIKVRRAKLTYGIGVIKPFNPDIHPPEKMINKNGQSWCMDILDVFVSCGQSIGRGEEIVRHYRPALTNQESILLHIFSTEEEVLGELKFVTEPGVQLCGSMSLFLNSDSNLDHSSTREIQVKMRFGETEIQASAVDISTGSHVEVNIDFLVNSNTRYSTKL
ncbi:heat shock 70 kDa protein 12A [Eurytemora carolleeae]|uniref:heat shock 70 kDa protein 12A n=1 Tax=Eurytemora carolleeae TaxID=1294199 RepID=UPI000C75EEA3|nr:heat shock 70 kDa protein 12A [Eurytemora carolleeae]|eukprot:XP_023335807.1 heat shock 70 kDa protein 12A-like [Eurytemora affinis]